MVAASPALLLSMEGTCTFAMLEVCFKTRAPMLYCAIMSVYPCTCSLWCLCTEAPMPLLIAQWSQFHGFCCTGPGSTMIIQGSSANDCGFSLHAFLSIPLLLQLFLALTIVGTTGRHGVVAMKGATAEISSCSSTRNGFAGCVSYGERSNLVVRHSNMLQNRHAGCGCYQGGCALVSTCNLDNNIDAGLHVVGPVNVEGWFCKLGGGGQQKLQDVLKFVLYWCPQSNGS